MNRLIFTFLLVGLSTLKAQTLQLPVEKETAVAEDFNNAKTCTLTFKLLDRTPGSTVNISFNDYNDGTATKDKDYNYPTALSNISIGDGSNQEFKVTFKVLHDDLAEPLEYFNLYVTYTKGGGSITDKVKITIKDAKDPDKASVDTSKWSVRLITGGSFDFFEGPIFKNFAGELKVFVPSLTKGKLTKKGKLRNVGFQTGFFNYRYYESDSSRGRITTERYLLDASNQNIQPGVTQYVRDVYALNSSTTFNNWGAYLNPMIRLKGNDWYDMYMNLHIEGIWRTSQLSLTKVNIRKDTMLVSQSDINQGQVFQAFPGIRALYTERNYFDMYVGLGFPIKIDLKKAFELYIDPTLGITNFSNTQFEQIRDGNKIIAIREYLDRRIRTFLLTKFQLTTRVAPVDIVLGGEFRLIDKKQMDKYPVYKAIYLGAVIPLDKWKK